MIKKLMILMIVSTLFLFGCSDDCEDDACTVDLGDIDSQGNSQNNAEDEINPEDVVLIEYDHYCTEEEMVQKYCTKEYKQVCGSDEKTHQNPCMACAAQIEGWMNGPCEGDSLKEELSSLVPENIEENPEENFDEGVIVPEVPSEEHICSDKEKSAQMCTMQYDPVCGSNGRSYGNGCSACSAGVDSWVKGVC